MMQFVTECKISLWEKCKNIVHDSKSAASFLSTEARLVGLFVNALGKNPTSLVRNKISLGGKKVTI